MGDETDIYRHQGLGGRLGVGERPALLLVDFVRGFLDPDMFGGGNTASALAATRPVLDAARLAGLPIVFTRIVYAADGSDQSLWCEKIPRLAELTQEAEASHVHPDIAPRAGEYVLCKRHASAFMGTGLSAWLAERGVDTVFVAGCTTSGCVRASVVDAIGLGFRPVVLRDCVGDRAIGPHEANLFDMEQKYADLVTGAKAISLLTAFGARIAPQDRP